MLHKEIIQGKINEARMGAKDLASVQIPQDATFGFEFEIASEPDYWEGEKPEDFREEHREEAMELALTEYQPFDVFDSMDFKERLDLISDMALTPLYGWVSHEEAGSPNVKKYRPDAIKALELPENTLEEKLKKLVELSYNRIANRTRLIRSRETISKRVYDILDEHGEARIKRQLNIESQQLKLDYYLDKGVTTGLVWVSEDHDLYTDVADISYYDMGDFFDNWNETLFQELYIDDLVFARFEEILDEMEENYNNEESSRNAIINYFSNLLGGEASYDYHGSPKSYDKFVVEPDSSIDPFGCEIVSPIYHSWDDAKNGLHEVLSVIRDEDVFTNESTGLHCNIGGPFLKKVDWVKFFVFFGEFDALAKWGRSNNAYTIPYFYGLARNFENNIEELTKNGRIIPDFDTTKKNLNRNLLDPASADKFKTINFSKIKDGYVEMRVAGGEDYETKENEIIQLIQRFLRAAAIAIDPNAYKEELYKKLYKLWDGDKLLGSGDNDRNRFIKKIHKFLEKIGAVPDHASRTLIDKRAGIIEAILIAQVSDKFTNPKIRSEFRELHTQLGPNNSQYTKRVISDVKEDRHCPKEVKAYFIQLLQKDL